jgi:hypothetical protein
MSLAVRSWLVAWPVQAVIAALAVHLSAWYIGVKLGHETLEPHVQLGAGQHEDSNVYFRRRYFVACNLGRRAGWLDGAVQFAIAPLLLAFEAVWQVGWRYDVEQKMSIHRRRILERLATGQPPFAPAAQTLSRVPCGRVR